MNVFKYYPPTDYNFDAIEKHYFYFSKAKRLNDPYDMSLKLINLSPQFKNLSKRLFPNQWRDFSDDYGTCSFSKDGLNKPMWAYYADSYKGFVIEYDEDKFEEITQELRMPVGYCDVHYVDECPNFDTPKLKIPYRNIGEKEEQSFLLDSQTIKDPKNLDRVFQYLWSIKEKSGWEHEQETRMILGNIPTKNRSSKIIYDENGYKVTFPKDAVKRIIVGYNMNESNIKRIDSIRQFYSLPDLYTVQPSEIPFDLKFVIKRVD